MTQLLTRIEAQGIGIYEAVEKACPRNDPRRNNKPDGSWLPRVGEKFPGAISFWKEKGFDKYQSSGLLAWHKSIVQNTESIIARSNELEIHYEDEFQVIGNFLMPNELRKTIISKHEFLKSGLKSKTLSVKIQKLAPGEVSSLPHAESTEEEFFYVLQGTPLVWLDGDCYQLQAGHCVGFPSGEGLCHNVINESSSDVLLLVIGERTKKDNLCVFPLHPDELKNNPSFNWTSWPKRKLGVHPGTPHSGIAPLEAEKHQRIVFAPTFERQKPFSYTGSTETFGRGARLSDTLDLNVLGFWHELLDSAKRSSWPHCHSEDEEFCYVMKGYPQVWMNGYVKTLQPGDLVYFEPGTSISHTLLNPDSIEIEYLSWGLSSDMTPDDAVYYPLHTQRNKECEGRGSLWSKYKKPKYFGKHPGIL